jgi:pimeloyl-ACP methyl ester carboxylesterase
MGLAKAIDANLQEFDLGEGLPRVRCYVDDPGSPGSATTPLVLIHSVNAAPSSMEMKPLFDHYRGSRPVYSLDLPGFGQSPRGDFPYSPTFYARVVARFLETALGGESPDIVALSLSAEFLARAIVEHEAPVSTATLISPTGVGNRQPRTSQSAQGITGFLARSPLGTPLWRGLVSRPSIRFFLGQAFHSGSAPKSLVDYAYATSHQPSAKFAPFAFLSMALFTPNAVESLYQLLSVPTFILYDRDPNIGFERLDELLRMNPAVRAERVEPSLGLPHWEHTERTCDLLDQFWLEQGG